MEQFHFQREGSMSDEGTSRYGGKPRIKIATIISDQSAIKEPFKQYQNAQRVWKGISFENIGLAKISTSLKSTSIRQEALSKNASLKSLYQKAVEYFLQQNIKPDVIVLYLPGVGFKGTVNGLSLAYDTIKPPYFIVFSDGAADYPWVVAHEMGHILYYSNIFGDKKDPNPYVLVDAQGEPKRNTEGNLQYDFAHNNNKNNVMYPRASKSSKPPEVTSEQMVKVRNSYLLNKRKRYTG